MGADPNDMSRMADRLTKLMRDKLAVKAESFPAALRRAGRRLPRRVRRDGQVIVTALEQAQNPRLARIADGAGAAKAARRIEGYLARIDAAKTKARDRAFLWADVALRLAAAIALVLVLLVWRGYL